MKKIIILTVALFSIGNVFAVNCTDASNASTYVKGKTLSLPWGFLLELETFAAKDDLGGRASFRALIKIDQNTWESVYILYDLNSVGEVASAKALYATLLSAYSRGDFVQLTYEHLCVAFNNTSSGMKIVKSINISKLIPTWD